MIFDLIYDLQLHYREVPDVHPTGDLLLYYVEGDPTKVVCPDVYVVKGVGKEPLNTFKVWEHGGRVPCLVIEVTSESTSDEDLEKKDTYLRLGVEELFVFDPLAEYLSPRLQGFRLRSGRYVAITPQEDGSLASATTGLLHRYASPSQCRLGAACRPRDAAQEEEAWRREVEARLATAAEEELARLRRELKDGSLNR